MLRSPESRSVSFVSALLAVLLVFGVRQSLAAAAAPSWCAECEYNCGYWSTSHTAPIQPIGSDGVSGSHANCLETGNVCGHPVCAGTMASSRIDAAIHLASATERLDAETVTTLLADYPDIVHLSVERQALQISGCTRSTIVAHFPLDRVTVAALLPAENQSGRVVKTF